MLFGSLQTSLPARVVAPRACKWHSARRRKQTHTTPRASGVPAMPGGVGTAVVGAAACVSTELFAGTSATGACMRTHVAVPVCAIGLRGRGSVSLRAGACVCARVPLGEYACTRAQCACVRACVRASATACAQCPPRRPQRVKSCVCAWVPACGLVRARRGIARERRTWADFAEELRARVGAAVRVGVQKDFAAVVSIVPVAPARPVGALGAAPRPAGDHRRVCALREVGDAVRAGGAAVAARVAPHE